MINDIVMIIIGIVLKSIVPWIWDMILTTMIVKQVAAKLKIVFSKSNLTVLFDIVSLAFYVLVLVNSALDKAAPTKLDILIAIGAVLACIVMVVWLGIDITKAANARKQRP